MGSKNSVHMRIRASKKHRFSERTIMSTHPVYGTAAYLCAGYEAPVHSIYSICKGQDLSYGKLVLQGSEVISPPRDARSIFFVAYICAEYLSKHLIIVFFQVGGGISKVLVMHEILFSDTTASFETRTPPPF